MLRVERIFGFHNREFVDDSTKIAIIPVNAQALFGAIPTREQQSKDMELYNGKYCGTYDDFAGIMTVKAIQHRVQRGQIEQARRACIGTPALFVVDSFPTKVRVEVYRRYPDLRAQAESREFIDSITPDGVAAQFFADYKIDDVRGLDYNKQIEYTNNASILAAFRSVIERADSRRASVSKPRLRKSDFWRRFPMTSLTT